MASITITGVDAIAMAFKTLESKLARSVIAKAERKALKIPYAQAKAAWPVKSGASKKTIRINASKGPRRGRGSHTIAMSLLVGAAGQKGDKEKGIKRAWWAFLIEKGFHSGGKRIRKAGKTVGYSQMRPGVGVKKIAGKHIMKRTLKSTESMVRQVFTDEILKGIESIAGK